MINKFSFAVPQWRGDAVFRPLIGWSLNGTASHGEIVDQMGRNLSAPLPRSKLPGMRQASTPCSGGSAERETVPDGARRTRKIDGTRPSNLASERPRPTRQDSDERANC